MDELDCDDVIGWPVPHRGEGYDGAAFATSMPENKLLFVAAHQEVQRQRDIRRHERGGTELPVERGLSQNTDRLAIRFSASTSLGVSIGRAGSNDIRIQNIAGISRHHAVITFDDENRPILRDLGSTGGTKVTYDEEEGERLSNFQWSLEGPSITNGKPPVLNLTNLVQFQVLLPRRDYYSSKWIEKVKEFRLGTKDPDDLFASLIIQTAQGTCLPSGHQTPSEGSRPRPILYQKHIGKGTFGIVTYVWNLTTREEYVVKRPQGKAYGNEALLKKAWRREAEIMRSISHEHIVAFRNATFSPELTLEFEYVRGGSLDAYTNLSIFETTQVLYQLSSALEHLRNQTPSIVHRDIKPDNILVERREEGCIFVKFADFGLSKAADILKTCCGTPMWAAPEIYLKLADRAGTAEDTYDASIDIWSLGVVIASLACGLPTYQKIWKGDAVGWIHAVLAHVKDHYFKHHDDLLHLLLHAMLVEDPDKRLSADHVTIETLRILNCMDNESNDESVATPTLTPSILGAQSSVESERSKRIDEDDDETVTDKRRQWLEPLSPEAQLSEIQQTLILETTEALPQGSAIDGLLWSSGGSKHASFTSSNEPQQGGDFEAGKAGAASGENRLIRKRSSRQGTHPSSVSQDQACLTGQRPRDHKRSRVTRDFPEEAKATV